MPSTVYLRRSDGMRTILFTPADRCFGLIANCGSGTKGNSHSNATKSSLINQHFDDSEEKGGLGWHPLSAQTPIDLPVGSSNATNHDDFGSHVAPKAAPAAAKKSSSILLKGATIIAYDDKKNELDIIRGGSLLIIDDRIADVGMKLTTPIPRGTEVVDVTNSIITPGFVDTHKHSWQHIYQTLAPDILLGDYVYKFSGLSKLTTQINADDAYISTFMSLTDSLNAG
ncbi:hypothetical protein BGZ90_008311, partial [Linnemannia elongata]